jgi:hypothetical protein
MRVPARVVEAASWEDQQADCPHGSVHRLEVRYPGWTQIEWDVNCPGCGRVCHLRAPEYPVSPDLSCPRVIEFGGCCGWVGYLRNGEWVALPTER